MVVTMKRLGTLTTRIAARLKTLREAEIRDAAIDARPCEESASTAAAHVEARCSAAEDEPRGKGGAALGTPPRAASPLGTGREETRSTLKLKIAAVGAAWPRQVHGAPARSVSAEPLMISCARGSANQGVNSGKPRRSSAFFSACMTDVWSRPPKTRPI